MQKFLIFVLVVGMALVCRAQEELPVSELGLERPAGHEKFLDKKSLILHSWNVAAETFDAITTRRGTNGGRINELNPFGRVFVNRGWGGQVAFSYGFGVGGPLLTSYLLHRTGHHKFERFVPAFNASASSIAGVWNLKH